jgi:16S rRNA (cytosine967-C5)-methyltransferase
LAEAVVFCLSEIFLAHRYADRVIEKVLQSNPKWGARDRAFIAENTYEIVRWWRWLLFLNEIDISLLSPKAGENVLDTASTDKTGTVSLMFAQTTLWQIFGTWQITQETQLPDWKEFKNILPKKIFEKIEESKKIRKIFQSIPDWLDEIGEKEIGTRWDKEIHALNQPAPVVLRANTLKISAQKLKNLLLKDEIETTEALGVPTALVLKKRINIFTSLHFKTGLFEIQDAASQQVATMLDAHTGMRVIDACAGAGGKALHLAAIMENTGKIIAMDVEEWKLNELQKRAKRAGVQNIETKVIDSNKVVKRLQDSADRLLLDVPCSGLGVLKRNPDAKWKMNLALIENIKKTQQEILANYSQMLKKGGKMVYATCSILPSESEEQVRWFLEAQKGNFELLEEKRISPSQSGFDGFYMACLRRA